ncbi:gluconokinase [Sphingomonas endophytica]|uniref:Gluconokinase n=1 Tax=Sphingomonas endophytica TaxID=869719 RepID=A0ABR6N559_9SPHN|nr:gluconokinase [Sphingomonas endophytica]MBB5725918.1 gluconokinase [Sphingomonas endophytica]
MVVRAGETESAPLALVVMGVSGTGKSTLGALLAEHWQAPFLEGDTYHSAANVAKMEAGAPLTDEDRWPWLGRLGAALGEAARTGGVAVAACSALRHAYRARLEAAAGLPLRFAFLDTGRAEIARRMRARTGHYMPPTLLDSQLATLEPPGAAERALRLDAGHAPEALCRAVLAWVEKEQV